METVPAAQESELLPVKPPMVKRHKYESGPWESYPYDDWADGLVHIATQGEDFSTRPQGFYVTLYQWARRNGAVSFQARVDGDRVIFKLGPLTAEQREIRRFYLTPEEYAEYLRTRPRREY
jgi:hypothetical protein